MSRSPWSRTRRGAGLAEPSVRLARRLAALRRRWAPGPGLRSSGSAASGLSSTPGFCGLRLRSCSFALGPLDVRIVRPVGGLLGVGTSSGDGSPVSVLGGSTSGERSRYSMPGAVPAQPKTLQMPRKILTSSSSSSSSSAAWAPDPAQPTTTAMPSAAASCALGVNLRSGPEAHHAESYPYEPLELTAVCGFRRASNPGIRALLRRCPPAGIHTRVRPPRQRWLHRPG